MPNDSACDGSRNTSLAWSCDASGSRRPKNRTRWPRLSSRETFSASSDSGPSPIMTSAAGHRARTRAKTPITSITRFTGRKFET